MKAPRLRRMMFIAWLPALGLATVLCGWGLVERNSDLIKPFLPILSRLFGTQAVIDPKNYRLEVWTLCFSGFLQAELWLSMILILMVGPNLISQDLRFNALPLYFSRPLRRIDYFFGKLGVIGAFIGMVVIVPAAIAYVLGLGFSLDITILRDTLPVLLACIAYGAVIAVSAGTLILALSSLSRNSRYIMLLWFAFWFVTGIVSWILIGIESHSRMRAHFMANQSRQQWDQSDWQKMMDDAQKEEMEASKTDWRPLVSYSGNLSRIGQQLLGTDAAWDALSELQPPGRRMQLLPTLQGPRYPWYWSAGILAVLFGISACILKLRIKSLDRLR